MKCKTCRELEWVCKTYDGNGYRCKKCGRAFEAKGCTFKIAILGKRKVKPKRPNPYKGEKWW